jgi:malonyl CoA-acyl carrier protein transacylase
MIAARTAPSRHASPTPHRGWDSHLFILRGETRQDLRARAIELAHTLHDSPEIDAAGLARQLAGELTAGGERLAVIAADTADLLSKLERAAPRLGDPSCKQIRDAGGVYYTSQPLYRDGSLALLFPGEGAQYLGMLADLCDIFPEVDDTFSWCDRFALESGRPEDSLRSLLHPPADAGPKELAEAERRLREFGPSIFGVLIADLALERLFRGFSLPVAAMAGHSAGELAALLSAGAIPRDALLGPALANVVEAMQRQADDDGDATLLAVGAGKAVVEEVSARTAGRSVLVAMDNCPHQSIAVGPTHLVAAVEAALLEAGVFCERLPFKRPYHTPLFEPWMQPYRDLFAEVPFHEPETPLYCCSTGARFPDDPAAVRELAIDHWVSPVEFVRMIEAMYADGIRIFVEAGPRGNLTTFVEDILRGRPYLAIPANVPRKSGPTQINHLIGQLLVHHVPLDIEPLFPEMRPPVPEAVPDQQPRPVTVQVMMRHLDVMEHFLEVQQSVMQAYLENPGVSASTSLEGLDDLDGLFAATPQPGYVLMETIELHEPGREIRFRRTMDEREDLYADHHTLAGRGVSRIDPGQNGLPVLPMTFSLEAMAEAASALAPGKVVLGLRDVRLFRWLPFEHEPTTLEVHGIVSMTDPDTGMVQVKASVRDLGNSFLPDGAARPACEAVVLMGDAYPESPEAADLVLTEEAPCGIGIEDLRRNMFHGPLFQMLQSLDRFGREGIEGTLEVRPRDGWFRSNPSPAIVLDPVLIDAAMHILGAWHLEQPDWTGRILLPYEVKEIDFYSPTPDIGSVLTVRGLNEQESARHFRHGLELLDPQGRPWLRMRGAGYWRFYLPFGHVNFFGPKDEYFLSRDWPEAVPPRSPESPPRRCHFLEPPVDLKQPVLRAAGARVTMTPREREEFRTWAGTDEGLSDWFFSRLLAKDAVRAAWAEKHGEAMFPADIESELVGRRIVCRPRGEAGPEPLPPVSVAIRAGCIASFSAFARHVGIALVGCEPDRPDHETVALAARQAVADALDLPEDAVISSSPQPALGPCLVRLAPGFEERYPDLADRDIRVHTAREKALIVATTLCETESP